MECEDEGSGRKERREKGTDGIMRIEGGDGNEYTAGMGGLLVEMHGGILND